MVSDVQDRVAEPRKNCGCRSETACKEGIVYEWRVGSTVEAIRFTKALLCVTGLSFNSTAPSSNGIFFVSRFYAEVSQYYHCVGDG